MPTSPPSLPSLIMKARVTLLEPCVYEGKHKVRLAMLSGNSSFLSSFAVNVKEFFPLGAKNLLILEQFLSFKWSKLL